MSMALHNLSLTLTLNSLNFCFFQADYDFSTLNFWLQTQEFFYVFPAAFSLFFWYTAGP